MSGMTRAERLEEMKRMYIQRAYSDIDLAKRLGTTRETIFRDRRELTRYYPIEKDDQGRYYIPRTKLISEIKVSLHEALTLYLSARKSSRQTRFHHPHAANAVEKLAATLRQPMTEKLLQAADTVLKQERDPERIKIIETLTQAWVEQRKVRIEYQPLGMDGFTRHTINIYLIEPSIWSDSVYAIALSDFNDRIVPFKIERIKTAFLSGETFEIPRDFDEHVLLKHAWGIWYGDKTPVMVKLRFNKDAARRMEESKWHPLEEVQPTEDGGCIWSADVAEWHEMLPWVRGWGADVEVLEPEGLKEELKQTARDLSTQYKVSQSIERIPYHSFWAKADRKKNDFHRLHYHLIDVGNVVLELWQSGLNNKLRQEITMWFGLNNTDDTGRLIAFLASLHDLGKASPAFQDHPYMPPKLHERIRRELRSAGFEIPPRANGEKRARHEIISTDALKSERLLEDGMVFPQSHTDLIAQMLGGHHGAWPQSILFSPTRLKPADRGNDKWVTARQALFDELVEIFKPPIVNNIQSDMLKDNITLTLVSGIVSVADWLGSDDENFPHEENILPVESYVSHSRQHARYALLRTNWEKAPTMPRFDFEKAFAFPPREAQQQVSDALNGISLPTLAIIEAPMGSGKTEAAIAVYAQWAKATGNSGLYVAMPTTATSNQMHSRIAEFLGKQFGKDIETLLIHSQALLRDVPEETNAVEEDNGNYQSTSQAWFLPRKKSLLAPFGVGTVDQALMSVLQTKHFFVRLLGLSNKVVIFDEVHAYDAYMSELFERLLIWLRQVGVSVIVLSATLPNKTRQRLVHAYAGKTVLSLASRYPCLTFTGSDGQVEVIKLTAPPEKTLRFEWIKRDEECIIQKLREELQHGGCAVVICNTVGRAQKLYEILRRREEKLCNDDNLILFHARFPMAWREELEHTVLRKFGPNDKDKSKPNPDRPTKAIVIATQVVEQSLDLDFDVMISDHAPMDLLLQRAGRLQRHDINNPRKQPYLLYIAAPEIDDDLPTFERSDTFVYDEYVLLRSWIILNNIATKQITLPTDLPVLIEDVYGDAEPTGQPKLLAALAQAKEEMTKKQIESEDLAEERMVREPSFRKLLYQPNMQLEEDDERVHKAFRALTREGNPGLQVICLHGVGDKLIIEPDELQTNYDHSSKLSSSMIRELARHAINVRHQDPIVEQTLLTDLADSQIKSILARWKKIAALRYHRIVIFENSECHLTGTGYSMRLSKEDKLGLQIYKEVQ